MKAETSVSYHDMYFRQANQLVADLLNAKNDLQKPVEAFVVLPSGVILMLCSN